MSGTGLEAEDVEKNNTAVPLALQGVTGVSTKPFPSAGSVLGSQAVGRWQQGREGPSFLGWGRESFPRGQKHELGFVSVKSLKRGASELP